jgi:uncharacterized membrane protein
MIPAQGLRNAVIGATLLLIALIVGWMLSSRISGIRVLACIAVTLPLWVLLPSLRGGNRRRYAAMTLCLVPYLVIALTELIANPSSRAWSSAVLLLSFTLFILLIAFLRVTRPRLD